LEDTLPKTAPLSVPHPGKTFLDTTLFVTRRLAFGLRSPRIILSHVVPIWYRLLFRWPRWRWPRR